MVIGIFASLTARADTQEVLALKAYADFKMGLYDSAFKQFEYLASLNNTQGLLNLAIMLDEGLGCDSDPQRATGLLERASAMGHLNAIERLAARYQSGTIVGRDLGKAIQLHEKAAKAGSTESMYQLFLIYSETDQVLARKWLNLAKTQQHPTALLADQLKQNSEVSPELELRIRAAFESIDRSANNRFIDGVIYYIDPQARIVIEAHDGIKHVLTRDQLGYLWGESFSRGGADYSLVRMEINAKSIDATHIQTDSILRETFDAAGEEFLMMRERAIISFDQKTLQIQSLDLSVEPPKPDAKPAIFPANNIH